MTQPMAPHNLFTKPCIPLYKFVTGERDKFQVSESVILRLNCLTAPVHPLIGRVLNSNVAKSAEDRAEFASWRLL